MQEPFITIVIATRNAEATLPGCLESLERNLAGADASLYEVLICDGHSTDETLPILAGYGFGDRVFSSEPRGIMDAFNRAAEKSRGKYTIFLNADDEWEPGWLAAVTRALLDSEQRHPHANIVVYTGVTFINGRGEPLFRRKPPLYAGWIHKRQSVILHPNAAYPTALVRKHPFQVSVPPCPSDQDQVYRLMKEARAVRLKDVDYRFRIWGRSHTILRASPGTRRLPSFGSLLCRLYVHCFETRLLHRIRMRIFERRTYWQMARQDGNGN